MDKNLLFFKVLRIEVGVDKEVGFVGIVLERGRIT
jgi:hypothetical protein